MLDKLLTLWLDFWNTLSCWAIIPYYENGILIRKGLFKKAIYPGWLWKIPYIDELITVNIQIETVELRPQSLTTSDNKLLVVSGIIKFNISNAKTFLLEIGSRTFSLQDISLGAIKHVLTHYTLDVILTNKLENEVASKIRQEVNKYGLKIHKVTFADLAEIPTYRIIGNLPLVDEE